MTHTFSRVFIIQPTSLLSSRTRPLVRQQVFLGALFLGALYCVRFCSTMLPVFWGRAVTLFFLGGNAPIESVNDARAVGYTLFALIFIVLLRKIHAIHFTTLTNSHYDSHLSSLWTMRAVGYTLFTLDRRQSCVSAIFFFNFFQTHA